jgi:hypothetical protein
VCCSLWGTDWILKCYIDEFPILNSSKLPPVVDSADLIIFRIIDKTITNSKFRCLSEATPYHHNVFTFTLFLPEGRVSVAWEPSNKMMLFLPPLKIKCLSLHPLISSLNLLFIYPSHLSLQLQTVKQTGRRNTCTRMDQVLCVYFTERIHERACWHCSPNYRTKADFTQFTALHGQGWMWFVRLSCRNEGPPNDQHAICDNLQPIMRRAARPANRYPLPGCFSSRAHTDMIYDLEHGSPRFDICEAG